MLLAVEGGGFFSSSASGYSKGLSVLLGQKNDDIPMRVSPWNQYQLVDTEHETDLQLASTKNRHSRGCASFICFGRVSAGLDTPSPLKVGPTQHQETLPNPLDLDKDTNHAPDVENDSIDNKGTLKSNLKKLPKSDPLPIEIKNDLQKVNDGVRNAGEHGEERRRVQWTDACGEELVEIREFEPSETCGSDDELVNGNERSCSCTIM